MEKRTQSSTVEAETGGYVCTHTHTHKFLRVVWDAGNSSALPCPVNAGNLRKYMLLTAELSLQAPITTAFSRDGSCLQSQHLGDQNTIDSSGVQSPSWVSEHQFLLLDFWDWISLCSSCGWLQTQILWELTWKLWTSRPRLFYRYNYHLLIGHPLF